MLVPPQIMIDVPRQTRDAIRRMQSPQLKRDTDQYTVRMALEWIGAKATYYAKHALGNLGALGAHIERAHAVSIAVRKSKGNQRHNPAALVDKGDLKRAIGFWHDGPYGIRFGVQDQHLSQIAFFHEYGYTIRVTPAMLGKFQGMARLAREEHRGKVAEGRDIAGIARAKKSEEGWGWLARAQVDDTWDVHPRPFLEPAMKKAWEEWQATQAKLFGEGLLRVAMHGAQYVGKDSPTSAMQVEGEAD